jgi:outer membrane biosynthesis protein TonB
MIALVLSLVVHALSLLGVIVLSPFLSGKVEARKPDLIEFDVVEAPHPGAKQNEPTFYSPLPPDRATQKPEHPDFLSNVTSRAQDKVPGGQESMPRMQGESDAPLVALDPGRGPTAPPSPPAAGAERREGTPSPQNGEKVGNLGPQKTAAPNQDREAMEHAKDSALLLKRPEGGSEFFQPEMSHPGGNATAFGDISLNTTAWEYAPWLERFRRALMEHWFAPSAYYYGILKEGGSAVIEVEITRSGQMARIDLLEEKEHPSLTRASMEALKSTAPFEPLPHDFPEPTLILRIQMVYPELHFR